MKAKLEALRVLWFKGESFFNVILGFNPTWGYELDFIYTGDQLLDNFTMDNVFLKCDSIEGTFVNARKQHITFTFALIKPQGFLIFLWTWNNTSKN